MQGVNTAAYHAAMVGGLRGVDMSDRAAHCAKVHKEEMLASLAASRSSFGSRGSPKGSTDTGSMSPSPQSSRIRASFRRALLQRYHTTLGAWKELDPRQHGRLAFMDFCRACRHLGYDSEARTLWEALDGDHDGFITLRDIDPSLTEILHGFASVLADASGSAKEAWQQHFSSNGMGRVPRMLFIRACEDIGYEDDAEVVFKALNIDRTPAGVSFQDFSVLDRWFQVAPAGRWDYGTLRPQHMA